MKNIYCNVCGNKIEEGQKYCSVCGAPAHEEIGADFDISSINTSSFLNASNNKSSQNNYSYTPVPESVMQASNKANRALPPTTPNSKSKKKSVLLPILAILAIALVGTGIVAVIVKAILGSFGAGGTGSVGSTSGSGNTVSSGNSGGSNILDTLVGKKDITTIVCFDGMIINSKGEYNDQFYSSDKWLASYKEWVYDDTFDHSQAVVVENGTCYYIDASLEYKVVAEGVDGAIINKNGGYIIYEKKDETSLYYYDIANGEATLVSDSCYHIENCAISNDGQYVVYYEYGMDAMVSYDKSGEKTKLLAGDYDCIAFSDDGQRGFFKASVDGKDVLYYLSMADGDIRVIDEKPDTTLIVSYDCREILAYGYNSLHFFSEEMEKSKVLDSDFYGDEIHFSEGDFVEKSDYCYGVHYSTLTELVPFAINCSDEIYWFYDKAEDVVILNYLTLDKRCLSVTKDKLEVLCLRDNKLMRQIVTGKDIHVDNYDDLEAPVTYIKSNKDMSIVYISMKNNVYSFDDGKLKLIEEDLKIWPDLDYEPYEDMFYFGKDLELYSVNGGKSTIELAYDNYNGFKHLDARYGACMVFEDTHGDLFLRIFGTTIPIDKDE